MPPDDLHPLEPSSKWKIVSIQYDQDVTTWDGLSPGPQIVSIQYEAKDEE